MNFKSRHTVLGIAVILLCFVQITSCGYATLVANAYTNVVVAISQDLPTDSGLVGSIQTLFAQTSEVLYNATGNRAYFGAINIVGSSGSLNTGVHDFRKKRAIGNQWQPPIPSFDSADFRIDVANTAYGDVPYTQQSRGCGEPGDFIHLTPDFVESGTDLVWKAKALANEWIKYRYGVFDENGYDWDELYPVMYYGTDGQPTYNMCNNNSDVSWATETCSGTSDIQDLQQQCTLEPDTTSGANDNINSSMMSRPVAQVATKYCTDSGEHNSDAPNKQNFMCGGQSIMEVVLKHSDFDGKNTPLSGDFASLGKIISWTTTTSNEYIGLVVVSDLMSPNQTRYNNIPALKKFIELDFPLNSYFGVIQNVNGISDGKTYSTVFEFKQIPDEPTRDLAAGFIQQDLLATDSPSAVQQPLTATVTSAIEILNADQDDAFSKAILLITDELTLQSDLSSICSQTNASQIQFHVITFNTSVFTAFNSFGGCLGQVYYIQAEAQTSASNDSTVCYADMQRRAQIENVLMNMPSTILPDEFDPPTVFFEQMYTNAILNSTFFVDAPVTSGETSFYVETCLNGINEVPAKQLNQLLYCTVAMDAHITYSDLYESFIDSTAINASGSYAFSVKNLKASDGTVPYVVYAVKPPTSKSSSDSQQTQLLNTEAWVITDAMENNKWTKVRIFASVRNGTTPIFDASVKAKIIASAGKANTNYTVTLVDDGSGNPDISAQDGIYSAYFTQLVTTSIQYSAIVTITDNDGGASYPTAQYPWITDTNDMNLQSTTTFQRTAQTNAFTAIGSSAVIPPGNITNFRVNSVNGLKIAVTWTAPGDDLDYGTATRYVFNCNTNKTYLQSWTKLDGTGVTIDSDIPSTSTKKAGTIQTTTFSGHYDQMVHYCAMQAVDSSGNYGSKSNIVSYFLVSDTAGGLSSASIAGIVVGVILGIILLIAIIVLIWYCLAERDDTKEKRPDSIDTEDQPESKLKPIMVQEPIAVDQRSNIYATETLQNNSRPPSRPVSMHSLAHSNQSGGYDGNGSDDDDNRSNFSKHTGGMQTFQQGKPYGIPVLPSENFQMQSLGGNHFGSPGLGDHGEQFDSTYLMANADVAVPQRLAKLATIEDVGEYHDKNILKGMPSPRDDIEDYKNIPIYNHILSKQAPPLPPPRSASSSQSSLSNVGNPKSISQV